MINPLLTFRSEGRWLIERESGSQRWDMAPSLAFNFLDALELSPGYRFGDLRDPDFSVRGGHGVFLTLSTRISEQTLSSAADFWRKRFGRQ
jgi:hypothetical protein